MKYHFVYRTHNLVNGKEYTGKHSTNNLNDSYYGSGKAIIDAVDKYGLKNFVVEILSFHETEQSALDEESRIVNEEYIDREDTYNQNLGGYGSWEFINSNELNIHSKSVMAKNINGKCFRVYPNDERLLTSELVGIRKGCVLSNAQKSMISAHFLGKFAGKDKSGNIVWVDVDDDRVKNSEIVHVNKGTKYDMKLVKCPHCGKEGKGGNMTRWHFDNCPKHPEKDEVTQLQKRKNRVYKRVTCPYCGKTGALNRMNAHHFENCPQKDSN